MINTFGLTNVKSGAGDGIFIPTVYRQGNSNPRRPLRILGYLAIPYVNGCLKTGINGVILSPSPLTWLGNPRIANVSRYNMALRPGFEPESRGRKPLMLGRTTPPEHTINDVRTVIGF